MRLCIILFIIIQGLSYSQRLTKQTAEDFVDNLLSNNSEITKYVHPEELTRSSRLGINYYGIKNKFLISYDIDERIKYEKNKNYKIKLIDLEKDYQKIEFFAINESHKINYYFKNGFLITPIFYYSQGWKFVQSKYFTFYISDTSKFNKHTIKKLDNFIDSVLNKLYFTKEEIELLEKEKIFYFLCKDEEEIEKLTGFRTRGIYILAYDYVVSIFNTHYHEIIHLLVNYKFKDVNIYTHPFFQEGLAVAFGGRGGTEPQVILELGVFIEKTSIISYKDLLSSSDFKNIDASISYPTSGIYNYFLIQEIGIEKYFNLYKKYSMSSNLNENWLVDKSDLPEKNLYLEFLEEQEDLINFLESKENFAQIFTNDICTISENNASYYFELKDTLVIDFFDDKGEINKYNFLVNQDEISIYDFQTHNLIAKYARGFSLSNVSVPNINGFWSFAVSKHIFVKNSRVRNVFLLKNNI
ncbi:MAG: hypothetical protein JW866_07135 [Ignavibacteriales bacterium]|nr:hypothetical protein [Ignavibacteriales bacterium]